MDDKDDKNDKNDTNTKEDLNQRKMETKTKSKYWKRCPNFRGYCQKNERIVVKSCIECDEVWDDEDNKNYEICWRGKDCTKIHSHEHTDESETESDESKQENDKEKD